MGYSVSDQPILGSADGNNFYTGRHWGTIPAAVNNPVEFYGALATNAFDLRLDNVYHYGNK